MAEVDNTRRKQQISEKIAWLKYELDGNPEEAASVMANDMKVVKLKD